MKKTKKTMLVALVAVSATAVVNAVIVQTTPDQLWNDVAGWGDGSTALSGTETYQANARFYTPTTGGSFDGGFLEMADGSNLQMQNDGGDSEAISANFILSGTTGKMGPRFSTPSHVAVNGTFSVNTGATFKFLSRNDSTTAERNQRIDAQFSGGSGATLLLAGAGTIDTTAGRQYIQISNDLNSFDGTWSVDGTRAIFTSGDAVGGGDVDVSNDGYLRVNTDWSGSSLTAVTGSEVEIKDGFAWTIDGLTVNGSSVANGTYTASQLNTLTSDTIFTGGTGTIQVIPEPATLGLVAAFGGAVLFIRRRFMI